MRDKSEELGLELGLGTWEAGRWDEGVDVGSWSTIDAMERVGDLFGCRV